MVVVQGWWGGESWCLDWESRGGGRRVGVKGVVGVQDVLEWWSRHGGDGVGVSRCWGWGSRRWCLYRGGGVGV